MPLYEYQCEACGQRFEVIQKFSDPAPDACARCGKGPVRRMQSSPAIQFKGTGWYVTDYAQKGKPGGGETPASGTGEAKKGDTASADTATKSDAPAKSTATPAASTTKPADG
jgi:putative FmdB family regulatory protein